MQMWNKEQIINRETIENLQLEQIKMFSERTRERTKNRVMETDAALWEYKEFPVVRGALIKQKLKSRIISHHDIVEIKWKLFSKREVGK